MNHIVNFNKYFLINENITPVTSNWFIVDNESSFDKKEEGVYIILNQNGNLSLLYKKKDSEGDEVRAEFYNSKDASQDKRTICDIKIISREGKDRSKKSFQDINPDTTIDILSVFFDYCDLENCPKEICDRFIMGASKSMKEVSEVVDSDRIPPSYRAFINFIKNISKSKKKSELRNQLDLDSTSLESLLIKFMDLFGRNL